MNLDKRRHMSNTNFRDDETLTDNLDDDQASRILTVLDGATQETPPKFALLVCLVKIINQSAKNDRGELFRDLIPKLEEAYVKT